jgi:hypothetical protein
MTLESGDMFEVTNADWIRANLPSYESVWQEFIGHDSFGWPLPIAGLSPERERDRQRFYQAHYSFARTALKLHGCSEEIVTNLGDVTDYSKFERMQDNLSNYAMYLGHVRDMFKIMQEALHTHLDFYGPLQSFYAQRSHLIHGPRLPFRIMDGMLMIPRIAGENKTDEEWDNNSTWLDIPPEKFVLLGDFVSDSTGEFFKLVNSLHAKVFGAACSFFEGRKISEIYRNDYLEPAPISGTWAIPAISAYHPTSGELSIRIGSTLANPSRLDL